MAQKGEEKKFRFLFLSLGKGQGILYIGEEKTAGSYLRAVSRGGVRRKEKKKEGGGASVPRHFAAKMCREERGNGFPHPEQGRKGRE